MPVYQLDESTNFPNPEFSEPDGLMAYGGDLSPKRLISAYSNGIFPWFSKGQPILWWSPDPRMVLFPKNFKRHNSLKQVIRSGKYKVTYDQNFRDVINSCATVPRHGQDGETWITSEMTEAYTVLHKLGIAHSVEVKFNGQIVGGLYGLALGRSFFGESMFHTMRDASKVALWFLVDLLTTWNFDMIDVQQETEHLKRMGAISINRKEFLNLLNVSLKKSGKTGSWNNCKV